MFAIFTHSKHDGDALLLRILKICDLYGASRFILPKASSLSNDISSLKEEHLQAQQLIQKSKNTLVNLLNDFTLLV